MIKKKTKEQVIIDKEDRELFKELGFSTKQTHFTKEPSERKLKKYHELLLIDLGLKD